MAWKVFSVEPAKIKEIDEALKDDIVSRQSIYIRDAKALGLENKVRYVLVEGDTKAVDRAVEIFTKFANVAADEEGNEVRNRIKSFEDDAAYGIGNIFGD
jgi:hypothetical protein